MVQVDVLNVKRMLNKKPRILLYDIETAPNLAYVWGKWEQDVVAFKQEWYMITFAWKWLGEKQTHVLSLPDFKTYKKDKTDDSELVTELWKLFNEADVVIAHNGNSFDQKKSNARFLFNNLQPPTPYKQIDTKLVAKRYFNLNSNSLNDLGQYLKLGEKLKTGGFDLWLGCMSGDKKSWKTMCDYNKQDVILLESVYLKLRSWDNQHPNLALMNGDIHGCPNCQSLNIQKRGSSFSRTGRYQRWQCLDCAKWSQSLLTDNSQIR